MPHNIFFISDTHFDHTNILKFTGSDGELIRPGFRDTNHMNEVMIENWNSVVKPGDKVYHLGDFCMGSATIVGRLMPRLNGRKRLVVGNHDQIKELCPFFEKVQLWRIFKEYNFVCTHIPLLRGQMRKVEYNVHGHIHQNLMQDSMYINVCVEHTNYTPVALEDITKITLGPKRP